MNSDFSDFIRFFPIFRLFPTSRLLDSTPLQSKHICENPQFFGADLKPLPFVIFCGDFITGECPFSTWALADLTMASHLTINSVYMISLLTSHMETDSCQLIFLWMPFASSWWNSHIVCVIEKVLGCISWTVFSNVGFSFQQIQLKTLWQRWEK